MLETPLGIGLVLACVAAGLITICLVVATVCVCHQKKKEQKKQSTRPINRRAEAYINASYDATGSPVQYKRKRQEVMHKIRAKGEKEKAERWQCDDEPTKQDRYEKDEDEDTQEKASTDVDVPNQYYNKGFSEEKCFYDKNTRYKGQRRDDSTVNYGNEQTEEDAEQNDYVRVPRYEGVRVHAKRKHMREGPQRYLGETPPTNSPYMNNTSNFADDSLSDLCSRDDLPDNYSVV